MLSTYAAMFLFDPFVYPGLNDLFDFIAILLYRNALFVSRLSSQIAWYLLEMDVAIAHMAKANHTQHILTLTC